MAACTDVIPPLELHGGAMDRNGGTCTLSSERSGGGNVFRMRGREGARRGSNDVVSVFLLSTQRLPHGLRPPSRTAWALTRLVENCLTNYRNAILLAREYAEKAEEEEGAQLRMCLLGSQERKQARKTDVNDDVGADASGSTPLLAVERQLWKELGMRDAGGGGAGGAGGAAHPLLLTESLHYRHILQDMKQVARGLLPPIEILRQRHHWLLVQEDVRLSLASRLFHYRVVVRRSPPIGLAERLWCDLWSLLGAAWRQRGRLMGMYAECIPPLDLDTRHLPPPPPPTAPPSVRDEYRKRWQEHRRRHVGRECLLSNGVTPHEEDSYAFGPLLPHRVGITTSRHHAIRVPILSFLRSLRVRVNETTSGTCTTSAAEGERSKSASSLGGWNRTNTKASNGSADPLCCSASPEAIEEPCHVAFFDVTDEDVEASRVPYVSPEWFIQLRLHDKEVAPGSAYAAVTHTYSDDAWNIAVLTVEFMLSGFPLDNSCCGHFDHSGAPTGALFDDIVELLVVHHEVSIEGAQNFIYAALHELASELCVPPLPRGGGGTAVEGDGSCTQGGGPTPQRLAQQWCHYLRKTYGSRNAVLRAIAENGLQWSRSARWEAFQAAHAVVDHDEKSNKGDTGSVSGPDAAQRVLDELLVPMLPLHPSLCAAAAAAAAAVKSGVAEEPSLAEVQQEPSRTPLWEVHSQVQAWRHIIERHAVVDGSSQRSTEAKQAAVFKGFVQVVQRALLFQGGGVGEKSDDHQQYHHHPRYCYYHYCDSAHRCESSLSQGVMLDVLLRGLMERGALFSHRVDCSGSEQKDEDADSHILQVFPFSHVFLSASDFVCLLREHVVSLCASLPAVTLAINSLDSIVGIKLSGSRTLHLPPSSSSSSSSAAAAAAAAAEATTVAAGILTSVKSVIRTVDLSVTAQLALVAGLRPLLWATPSERRASLVRRYLRDVQTARGDVEVPVPATLRGEVWAALLLVPLNSSARATAFYTLDTTRPSSSDRQLAVDIPRCHQYHPLLASAEGHERMWNIIKAWMLMNPGLTYWQGMDSVCAVLLAVTPTDDALVVAQLHQLTQRYISHDAVSTTSSSFKSMEDHLHQLSVLLRYYDPCLAVHLLDTVECKPELFAISWFLTLFAHGVPIAKHREQLLGKDFSTCLSTLSRVPDIDVHRVLHGTREILRDVPQSIALMPYHSMEWGAVVRHRQIPHMDVQTILGLHKGAERHAVRHSGEMMWARTGLFLVDLRARRGTAVASQQQQQRRRRQEEQESTCFEERVVGALLFPLAASHEGSDDTSAAKPSQRSVSQLATELLLQMRNLSMAAIPPSLPAMPRGTTTTTTAAAAATMLKVEEEEEGDDSSALLCECVTAPHVVLFTHASTTPETAAVESLAMELVRYGTPHVSILLGGFVQLKLQAPHLVVGVESD